MVHIKTEREIDFIRESCKITGETLEVVKRAVKPGVTTLELDLLAEEFIRIKGGRPAFKGYKQHNSSPFPGTLCTSIDNVIVHGIPGNRKLVEGEILSIDVGVEKNGYYGDSAITVPVGTVSEEKMRLLSVTEKSLYLGIEQAVSGNKLHDISAAIQEYVESFGFSIVRALCGHGVGKKLHEDPNIPNYGIRGTGPKLKSGMTLAIEPMVNAGGYRVDFAVDGWAVITADGSTSAHFEHSILVTKDKAEILTAV